MTIPLLKTTGEAIEFGKTATKEQIVQLQKLYESYNRRAKVFLEYDKMDQAFLMATRGQFCREAVEVLE